MHPCSHPWAQTQLPLNAPISHLPVDNHPLVSSPGHDHDHDIDLINLDNLASGAACGMFCELLHASASCPDPSYEALHSLQALVS